MFEFLILEHFYQDQLTALIFQFTMAQTEDHEITNGVMQQDEKGLTRTTSAVTMSPELFEKVCG